MEITQANINAIIQLRIAENAMEDITSEDLRIVLTSMGDWTEQGETKLTAITAMVNEGLALARANESKNTEQDGRLDTNEGAIVDANEQVTRLGDRLTQIEEDGTEGLTPEEREANRVTRDANTATGAANSRQLVTQGNQIGALQTEQGEQDTAISGARGVADTADGKADMAIASIGQVASRVAQNEADISNHKTQDFDPLAERVGDLETEDNTLKQVIATQDREITANTGGIAELRESIVVDAQDFIEEVGRIEAINPSQRYSGVNGDAPDFAEITIPLSTQFPDLEDGRRIRISDLYLIPLFADQGGAESEFFFVIDQGDERISGRGNPTAGNPTRQVVERDWVRVNPEDSSVELVFDAKTGSDPVIKFAMVWTGTSGSFSPRLTGGNLHYIGRLRDPVAGVVRDVVGADITALQEGQATQTADIAGLRADVDVNSQRGEDNADLAHGLRDRLDKPQFAVIENAGITTSTTITTDPTALNNELGGGSPFARQLVNGAVAEETQFLTRVTSADQVLDYGAGRVLDVFEGRVRGFVLVPRQDATSREETRYITTPDGYGTRTRPAVLEFGNGAPTPKAQDNELFLNTGIPASDAEITNISMAFAVRLNGNWSSIPNTLQFAIRSGESRSFNVPSVVGVTFTATALADGRIQTRATHPNGGDPNQLATNGGAIRFDAAYVETIRTAQVDRGQTTVDLGAFTGNNLVGFDAIQTGDNGEATAYYVTPSGRFNTGYFLLDVHRVAFATDNPSFTFLASDADTELTPAVMARLDGTDEYLGLFARNNHNADGLQLRTTLTVPTTDGTANLNLADEIQALREQAISGNFKGDAGESAYALAVRLGYNGTQQEWLASLVGADGTDAYQNWLDLGNTGSTQDFIDALTGEDGDKGQSAYLLAVAQGFSGSELEWIASLKGDAGDSAYAVAQAGGFSGTRNAWLASLVGADAYAVAVADGFTGDRTAWLASLVGAVGDDAYEVAVADGFSGSRSAWLASLVGERGLRGRGFTPTGQWLVGRTYNTDDLVTHNGETFLCLFDSITGANFEPRIGSTWASGFALWAARGDDAYEVAVAQGFSGTRTAWLESLVGATGADAYDVAVEAGYSGTRQAWLESLVGATGDDAYEIAVAGGFVGERTAWLASLRGASGASAYAIAVAGGYVGTEQQWIASLKGDAGDSAYQVAVDGGYSGTEQEWLASLKGDDGDSAYQVAVADGFSGSRTEWLASIRGGKGDIGRGFTPRGEWVATATYNTDDIVTHPSGVYRAITDNITSATFEPSVGAAWASGFELWAGKGADGKDADDASVLDEPDYCAVTSPPSTATRQGTLSLTLACDDTAPTSGSGSLVGLVIINSPDIINASDIFTLSDGNFVNLPDGSWEIIGGDGTNQLVIQVGNPNAIVSSPLFNFADPLQGILIQYAGRRFADGTTASFDGRVDIPNTAGVLRERSVALAQTYGVDGRQLREISSQTIARSTTNFTSLPSQEADVDYDHTIALVISDIPTTFQEYTGELQLPFTGGYTARFFYSDTNDTIATLIYDDLATPDVFPLGAIDAGRPISVQFTRPATNSGIGAISAPEGTLITTGRSFGTLYSQDIANAQGVVDANLEEGGSIAEAIKEGGGGGGGATAEDIAQAMTAPVAVSQTYTATAFAEEVYPLDITPPAEATQGGRLSGVLNVTNAGSTLTGIGYRLIYTSGTGTTTIIEDTGFQAPQVDGDTYSVVIPETPIEARNLQFRIMTQGQKTGDSQTFAFDGNLAVGEDGVLVAGARQIAEEAVANAGGGTALLSGFTARASDSGQTLQDFTAWNDVVMDTPDMNQNGDFSGNAYTAPESGMYWFSLRVSVVSDVNNRVTNVGLSINGADPLGYHQVEGVHSSGTRAPVAELSIGTLLAKGDVITMQFRGTTGRPLIPAACLFSGFLIGATG